MPWVAVAVAPNEPIAESWAELLRQQGIPAYAKTEAAVRTFLGAHTTPVRVMVPQEREAEGKRVLEELMGPEEDPE